MSKSSQYCFLGSCELSSRIVHELLKRGQEGHWGSIRETGYALWALRAISNRPDNIESFIEEGSNWLKSHAEPVKNADSSNCGSAAHFEDEVWDSSLALLALPDSEIKLKLQVTRWLLNLRRNTVGAFDGDIWETCWAVLALSQSASALAPSEIERLGDSIRWLVAATSKSGLVVSPGYTGLVGFALVLYESARQSSVNEFESHKNNFYRTLCQHDSVSKLPWGDEIWANSLVIAFGGHCLGQIEQTDHDFIRKSNEFIETLLNSQASDSAVNQLEATRTEDLSLSLIGLISVASALANTVSFEHVSHNGNILVSSKITCDLPKIRVRPRGYISTEPDGSTVLRITKLQKRVSLGVVAVLTGIVTIYENWQTLAEFTQRVLN